MSQHLSIWNILIVGLNESESYGDFQVKGFYRSKYLDPGSLPCFVDQNTKILDFFLIVHFWITWSIVEFRNIALKEIRNAAAFFFDNGHLPPLLALEWLKRISVIYLDVLNKRLISAEELPSQVGELLMGNRNRQGPKWIRRLANDRVHQVGSCHY